MFFLFCFLSIFSAAIDCSTSYQTTHHIRCTFSLTNDGRRDYSVLKWRTPLDGLRSDCLAVTRNGKKIPYDGIYMKRSMPGPDQFLFLVPGQTVSSTFDVSEGYDMTKAGKYSIAVDTVLEYALGSVEGMNVVGKSGIQTNIAYLSSPVEVFYVTGNTHTKITTGQKARNLEKRKRFYEISFSRSMREQNITNIVREGFEEAPLNAVVKRCSEAQRRITKEVHLATYDYAKSAILELENNEDMATLWFGESHVSNAIKVFKKMVEILQKDTVIYIYGGKYCERDMFAYTFPGTRKIFLCKKYQKAPKLAKFDSKMGILTHELSHAICRTRDIVYGQSACKKLAKKASRRAVKNADNYEYFVETLSVTDKS